jgi:serine/threonine-protein kinase HipA
MLTMPSCIRDASPDAWGRRVIINRVARKDRNTDEATSLDEITYLLESGSDRIGALDFQASASTYVPRHAKNTTLNELMRAAELVQAGVPLSPELDQALLHGSSIGGARPKALVLDGDKKMVAKFSASNDTYGVVQGEYVAMRLAALAGLDVAPARIVRTTGKFALLVERFDRTKSKNGWRRKILVSALTVLGLDEMEARYASYADLAEQVRLRFIRPGATQAELFRRITFNILVGNTDDHARNHAAFWDGSELTLSPAYDICPQGRTGNEASQAMLIRAEDRSSRISTCLAAAGIFGLRQREAAEMVEHQLQTIRSFWQSVCDEAEMTKVDRSFFMGRQFLNRFAFEDLTPPFDRIRALADEVRTC